MIVKRIRGSIGLLLLLAVLVGSRAPVVSAADWTVVERFDRPATVAFVGKNLYEEPFAKAAIVARVPSQAPVQVLERVVNGLQRGNTWYLIAHQGTLGYCHENSLSGSLYGGSDLQMPAAYCYDDRLPAFGGSLHALEPIEGLVISVVQDVPPDQKGYASVWTFEPDITEGHPKTVYLDGQIREAFLSRFQALEKNTDFLMSVYLRAGSGMELIHERKFRITKPPVFFLPEGKYTVTALAYYPSGSRHHFNYIRHYVLNRKSETESPECGMDVLASAGTLVTAIDDATVHSASWSERGGYYVVLHHPVDDSYSYYGHLMEQAMVKKGQKLAAGDPLGRVGQTGLASGPHVHFIWSKHDPFCEFRSLGIDLVPYKGLNNYPHDH